MNRKFDYRTPTCFEDTLQWRTYQKFWKLSKGTGFINYCLDCTPEYQKKMVEQNRCAYPKTTFIIKDNELLGMRSKADYIKLVFQPEDSQ